MSKVLNSLRSLDIPAFVNAITVNLKNDFKNFLPLTVAGTKVHALLDSGNNYHNAMSLSFFKSLGFELSDIERIEGNPVVSTAQGHDLQVMGVPKHPLTVSLGPFLNVTKIRPVIINNLNTHMNLSGPWMKQMKFVQNFAEGYVLFRNKELPLSLKEDSSQKPYLTTARAYVLNSVTIPPNSGIHVPLHVPEHQSGAIPEGDGFIRGHSSLQYRYDVSTWNLAAVRLNEQGLIPGGFWNLTEEPVTIPAGTHYGSFRLMCDYKDRKQYPYHLAAIRLDGPIVDAADSPASDWSMNQAKDWLNKNLSFDNPLLKDPKIRFQLLTLLARHITAFSIEDEFGYTTLIEHEIITREERPIRQKMRVLSPPLAKILEKQLDVWLKQGVIEPSTSEWSSVLFAVPKGESKSDFRWVNDFRGLNAVTVKDSYPLPSIQDNMNRLCGSTIFSVMDSKGAFHVCNIRKKDRHKTAFNTVFGSFQFRRLPFGLSNAPATYARLVQRVLEGIPLTEALPYLDDIIIHSKDVKSHFQILDKVLTVYRKAGLKLSAKKCNFFGYEVEFLGHHISRHGILPTRKFTAIIRNWPFPKTKGHLRIWLGKVGYYRRFIKDFCHRAKPLQDVMKGEDKDKTPLEPTPERVKAFKDITQAVASPPCLAFPDFDSPEPFILDTDWSKDQNTIAGVLSQKQKGLIRPICFGAKRLPPSKHKCSSNKGELSAIVYFIRAWRYYLLHRPFLLRTDHLSLTSLKHMSAPDGQVARWLETISNYDFTVIHRAGKNHGNADALSRIEHAPQLPEPSVHDKERILAIQTRSDALPAVALAQDKDEDLALIKATVTSGRALQGTDFKDASKIQNFYFKIFKSLLLVNNVLKLKLPSGALRTCLPRSMWPAALKLVHDDTGHIAFDRSLQRLQARVIFPGMRSILRDYIRSCIPCQRKLNKPKDQRHTLRSDTGGFPMKKLAIDFVGPLPCSTEGHSYLFTAKDTFSKWFEAIPTASCKASDAIRALHSSIFPRLGLPVHIHSDNGAAFISKDFQSYLASLHIRHSFIPPHNAKSNTVERSHRDLNGMLRSLSMDSPHSWERHLPAVLFALRTSFHSSIGMSPYEVLYGHKALVPLDLLAGDPPHSNVPITSYASQHRQDLHRAFSLARSNLQASIQRQKLAHYTQKPCFF